MRGEERREGREGSSNGIGGVYKEKKREVCVLRKGLLEGMGGGEGSSNWHSGV